MPLPSLNSTIRKIGTVITVTIVIAAIAAPTATSAVPTGKEKEKKSLITPTTQQAIDRGLDYLATHQHEDGSFGSNHLRGNTAITSLAGIAMLAQGSTPGRGKYGKQLNRIIDYLIKHTEKDGLIINREATTSGAMYEQGFAVLFLSECHGMTKHSELRPKLALAVKLIIDTQNKQGGWRYNPIREKVADISVTTCQVMALRAAKNAGIHVPSATIDAAVRYIRDCRNPDGGFKYIVDVEATSMFPRSAAAVAALQSAGIYEGKELEQSLDYLMKYPSRSGKKKDTGYFFMASTTLRRRFGLRASRVGIVGIRLLVTSYFLASVTMVLGHPATTRHPTRQPCRASFSRCPSTTCRFFSDSNQSFTLAR